MCVFADVVYWLVVRAARLSTTVPIVRIFALFFSVCVFADVVDWLVVRAACFQQQCQLFVSLPYFSLSVCVC